MVSAVYNTRVFLLLGQDLLRVMDLMTKQPKKKKKRAQRRAKVRSIRYVWLFSRDEHCYTVTSSNS